jgi:hypothetical protein
VALSAARDAHRDDFPHSVANAIRAIGAQALALYVHCSNVALGEPRVSTIIVVVLTGLASALNSRL